MPTTWNIGVDWNRDGFLCRDARPGDALNLLPTPLTHAILLIGKKSKPNRTCISAPVEVESGC